MALLVAISDRAATLSLAGQLAAMIVALFVGRCALKSRGAIWIASFLGALGAMAAHMLVDGQGAFLLLIYAPVIYLFAVAGRGLP